jgi:hypothetical protein
MSFNENNLIPCERVLPNIVLYIDHEIFDNPVTVLSEKNNFIL